MHPKQSDAPVLRKLPLEYHATHRCTTPCIFFLQVSVRNCRKSVQYRKPPSAKKLPGPSRVPSPFVPPSSLFGPSSCVRKPIRVRARPPSNTSLSNTRCFCTTHMSSNYFFLLLFRTTRKCRTLDRGLLHWCSWVCTIPPFGCLHTSVPLSSFSWISLCGPDSQLLWWPLLVRRLAMLPCPMRRNFCIVSFASARIPSIACC
mmetsp:Transcript_31590/g.74336  ORF Transcript_31590/g.74336 Transcript_31590/m.74336 type:complete len:202 (-) Transcript_31590:160-765(-)